jgi:hypothetical protein
LSKWEGFINFMEKEIIDFTDRFDRLLNKKPKSGSLKEWNQKWDKLMKEFTGNEEQTAKKTGKGGGKEKKQGNDVGDVPRDLEGKTPL